MRCLTRAFFFLIVVSGAATARVSHAANPESPAFVFQEVGYFHRWSKDEQHEFTPEKQEDLNHWSDMITINAYPGVDDGEKMAGTANAVLGNYKSHDGRILKTRSVPETKDRPAEHFVAVMFTRPGFVEVAFAAFKLVDGKGYSFVYSHRIYGETIGDQTSAWLSGNEAQIEKALMEWKPSPTSLRLDWK